MDENNKNVKNLLEELSDNLYELDKLKDTLYYISDQMEKNVFSEDVTEKDALNLVMEQFGIIPTMYNAEQIKTFLKTLTT